MLTLTATTLPCPHCTESVFIAPGEHDNVLAGLASTICMACLCRFLVNGEITAPGKIKD